MSKSLFLILLLSLNIQVWAQKTASTIIGSWDLQYQIMRDGNKCDTIKALLVFNANRSYKETYTTEIQYGNWKPLSRNKLYLYNNNAPNCNCTILNYPQNYSIIKDTLILYHLGGDAKY